MEPFRYGGQAVIEGVMIRGPYRMAIALRRPNREILVHREGLVPLSRKWRGFKLPILRGVAALVESLATGVAALMFSADQAARDEGEELGGGWMLLSVVLAVAIAVLVFVVSPTLALGYLRSLVCSSLLLNLVEGLLRVGILVAYVGAISRLRDVQRVLEYHGAEHKVIHAHEAGEELTIPNVRKYSPLHPRCGTSFLFFVAMISILLFSLFGWPGVVQRILLRLALLPVVVGVSYEVIRLAGRKPSPLLRAAVWPGLLLQRLTTREPADDQIEVAIASFRAAAEEPGSNL